MEAGYPPLFVVLEDDGHTSKVTVEDTEDCLMVTSNLSRDEQLAALTRVLQRPCKVVSNVAGAEWGQL